MEDYQKEFLHIKGLINQKAKIFLDDQDYFTINIDEEVRSKVKRFWGESTVEQQVAMFLDNNGLASRMVTSAMQSFGDMYIAAKKNPSSLSQIDKAITEKTYFSKEVLPGFEGRLAMTQLFCNGRNSNGAYRMHNFFYLLPTDEFENESKTTDDIKINEVYNGVETFSGSKDAMYCINLLKEVYGSIKLRYFKMGVFLGDYLPDNLWSVWRYMNCREFTFGVTKIIPAHMYNVFIEAAGQYFRRFLKKLQPCILTQLWQTNFAIAIFSTLFENNMLLAFFSRNPKVAKRYGFTGNCLASQPSLVRKSIGTPTGSQCSGSDSSSERLDPQNMMSSASIRHHPDNGAPAKSKSHCANSNDSGSNNALSSSSLSISQHSYSQTRSSRGFGELNLKKPSQFKQHPKTAARDTVPKQRDGGPQLLIGPSPICQPTAPVGPAAWKGPLHYTSEQFENCAMRLKNYMCYLNSEEQFNKFLAGLEPPLIFAIDAPVYRDATASSDPEYRKYLQRNKKINASHSIILGLLSDLDHQVGQSLIHFKQIHEPRCSGVAANNVAVNLSDHLTRESDPQPCAKPCTTKVNTAPLSHKVSQDSLIGDSQSEHKSWTPLVAEPTKLRSEHDADLLFGNLIRLQRVRVVPKKLNLPASFNSLKLEADGVAPRFRRNTNPLSY